MKLRYQLFLQFRGDSLDDYDQMIELEDCLIATIGSEAEVDGHDCGSGETNIFIRTNDPAKTFIGIQSTLSEKRLLEKVTAAYRPSNGDDYKVIWPEGTAKKFTVT